MHGHSLSDVEEDEDESLENAIYEPGEFIERKKRAMTKKVSYAYYLISRNLGCDLYEIIYIYNCSEIEFLILGFSH